MIHAPGKKKTLTASETASEAALKAEPTKKNTKTDRGPLWLLAGYAGMPRNTEYGLDPHASLYLYGIRIRPTCLLIFIRDTG